MGTGHYLTDNTTLWVSWIITRIYDSSPADHCQAHWAELNISALRMLLARFTLQGGGRGRKGNKKSKSTMEFSLSKWLHEIRVKERSDKGLAFWIDLGKSCGCQSALSFRCQNIPARSASREGVGCIKEYNLGVRLVSFLISLPKAQIPTSNLSCLYSKDLPIKANFEDVPKGKPLSD